MIRVLGIETISFYSQTLNGCDAVLSFLECCIESGFLVGHFW